MLPGTEERQAATPEGSGADPVSGLRSRREVQRRPAPRWRRWAAVAAVCVLVVVVGATAFAVWRLNANIDKVDVSEGIGTDRPVASGEAVNILLIGSDTREGTGNDAYGDNDGIVGGAHSDTNLLVHLSADRSSATVVSIPRDSMTPAPPGAPRPLPRTSGSPGSGTRTTGSGARAA